MKKQLFGLRRAPVNRYIKQLKIDSSMKTTELQEELSNIKEENKQLEQSILAQENLTPPILEEEEIWKLGQERIGSVMDFLEEKKEIEMEEMRRSFAENLAQIVGEIKELDVEIQSIEKRLEHMVNGFFQKTEQPEPYQESELQLLGEQEAAAGQEPAVEPVTPLFSGTTANDNFWGDIEQWTTIPLAASAPEPAFTSQLDEAFTEKVIHEPVTEEVRPEPKESGSPVQSDVLIEQIDSIKTQYIVGKVAGGDLYDLKGQLIVARNAIITKEAVERANQCGKLADLIVNMMLSGGGAE